jgi:hypothetical protein
MVGMDMLDSIISKESAKGRSYCTISLLSGLSKEAPKRFAGFGAGPLRDVALRAGRINHLLSRIDQPFDCGYY